MPQKKQSNGKWTLWPECRLPVLQRYIDAHGDLMRTAVSEDSFEKRFEFMTMRRGWVHEAVWGEVNEAFTKLLNDRIRTIVLLWTADGMTKEDIKSIFFRARDGMMDFVKNHAFAPRAYVGGSGGLGGTGSVISATLIFDAEGVDTDLKAVEKFLEG